MNPDRKPERIEIARAKLGTVSEVMTAHGLTFVRGFASCPFHDEKTPSFHAVRGAPHRYMCFGCGAKGDVLDLEQHLSRVSLPELLDELVGFEETPSRPQARQSAPARAEATVAVSTSLSPPEYLRARGVVSDAVIEASGIRFVEGGVLFPWRGPDDTEIYTTTRAINGTGPKYKHSPGPRPPLFATSTAWHSRKVVLVEGHLDAIAAEQAMFAAFATAGSQLSDEAAEILAVKDEVILVADVDQAGAKWRTEVIERLKGRTTISEATLPEGVKDLDDVAQVAAERGDDPGEAVFEVLDAAIVLFPGPFKLRALDFEELKRVGLPQIEWLEEPYLPLGARIWAWGAAESGKSLWALFMSCKLSRAGVSVLYVSQENPLVEDVRRLDRLRPNWKHMRFFHDQGLDLAQPDHVAELVRAGRGCRFIVLDTLTAAWTGDEEGNPAIAAFDRDVMQLMVRELGASVLVLDHTGHQQAFVKRKGVTGGRGASSKGQKADVVLEFIAEGQSSFKIHHAKNRMGGHKQPPLQLTVVDEEDGTLDLREVEQTTDDKISACADAMVEQIHNAGQLTAGELHVKTENVGGKPIRLAAMSKLRAEDPPRVIESQETIVTPSRGKQKAKVWRPAGEQLRLAPRPVPSRKTGKNPINT